MTKGDAERDDDAELDEKEAEGEEEEEASSSSLFSSSDSHESSASCWLFRFLALTPPLVATFLRLRFLRASPKWLTSPPSK